MRERREEVLGGRGPALAVGSHREVVLTLGRHAPDEQVFHAPAWRARGGLIRRVERGGGVTAHGPGQLVLYPVLCLPPLGLSIPRLTALLEDVVLSWLAGLGIQGQRRAGFPGVYVADAKIASIGFRVHHGVVTHGLSLNVCNDLDAFAQIVPCGQPDLAVTSVQQLMPGAAPRLDAAADQVCSLFLERCGRG